MTVVEDLQRFGQHIEAMDEWPGLTSPLGKMIVLMSKFCVKTEDEVSFHPLHVGQKFLKYSEHLTNSKLWKSFCEITNKERFSLARIRQNSRHASRPR